MELCREPHFKAVSRAVVVSLSQEMKQELHKPLKPDGFQGKEHTGGIWEGSFSFQVGNPSKGAMGGVRNCSGSPSAELQELLWCPGARS